MQYGVQVTYELDSQDCVEQAKVSKACCKSIVARSLVRNLGLIVVLCQPLVRIDTSLP